MGWSYNFIDEAKAEFVECFESAKDLVFRGKKLGFVELRGIYRLNASMDGIVYNREFDLLVLVGKTNSKIPLMLLPTENMPKGFEHVNPDKDCCLGTAHEVLKKWGPGKRAEDFFRWIIDPYLVNLISFCETGKCVTKERPHGYDGLKCYYSELLGMTIPETDITLKYIFDRVEKKVVVKGHHICPCGSTQNIRKCHMESIRAFVDDINCNELSKEGFMQDMSGIMEYERRKR